MCEGARGVWSTMNITGTLTGCQGTVTMEQKKDNPNILSGVGLLPELVKNVLSIQSDSLYLVAKKQIQIQVIIFYLCSVENINYSWPKMHAVH